MKHYLRSITIATIVLVIFGFINHPDESEHPKKEWVIAPQFLKLQKGVSKEEARKWLEEKWLPGFRNYPGFNAMLGEPIKSGTPSSTNTDIQEKADFVMIYYFDSQVAHQRYFTPTGLNDEIKKVIKENRTTWDAFFGKYFIQDKYQKEEYLMFATSK